MFCPFIMAEETICSAGRQHQIVKGDAASIGEVQSLVRRVDADNLSHDDRGVVLTAQENAGRGGDIGRRECGGRHLIQQGLEQVVIGPVDQQDVSLCPLQRPGCGDAAKSGADYHNSWAHSDS